MHLLTIITKSRGSFGVFIDSLKNQYICQGGKIYDGVKSLLSTLKMFCIIFIKYNGFLSVIFCNNDGLIV